MICDTADDIDIRGSPCFIEIFENGRQEYMKDFTLLNKKVIMDCSEILLSYQPEF